MVKLFSKNSKLCDHNSPTSQTDGQRDRQTTCDRNTALCTKVHRAEKNLYSIEILERLSIAAENTFEVETLLGLLSSLNVASIYYRKFKFQNSLTIEIRRQL